MAEVEEPKFNSLQERIAALNSQKNFQAPEAKPKRAPPPPPPNRPAARSQTLPVVQTNGQPTPQKSPSIPPRPTKTKTNPPPLPRRTTDSPQLEPSAPPVQRDRIAPPPLPTRSSTQQISPALPPRRPSTQQLEVRRNSNASEISNLSALSLNTSHTSYTSDGSTRKLPPVFDQANLPALPPTKREREAQAKEAAARDPPQAKHPLVTIKSAPAVRQIEQPQRPALPPRLTSNSTSQQVHRSPQEEAEPAKPRRLPPPPTAYVKPQAQTNGHVQTQQSNTPPLPGRRPAANDDAPPPVPLASRPSAAQIEAVEAKITARANDCLICRDFSGPDGVAAQYPRQSLPRNDPVGYLAQMLCGPFSSYTDKARAIFTWFHHNVAYDCAAFFGNNIKARPGAETILSGKAVCSGYADTYREIANRAGLECITVTGHGKGYGYTALKKGERPPPRKVDGHAWNAVRIDGGEWKLLDACWGAGNVSDVTKEFTPDFKPHEFTRRNDIFGLSHYPADNRHFFRPDGRVPSWEEYYIGPVHGETPVVYSHAYEEGIWDKSIQPAELQIPVYSGQVVRFQFSKMCEHWTSEKHGKGKPPLLMLSINGRDGRKQDMVPIETDGYWHWADVSAIDLGVPGGSISVVMITTIGDRDARGVSAKEYFSKKGKVGMSWTGIMKWDLI
ncbi:transglutaminase-like superfamily protein [Colletotrichum karsti]|uniref:Transglutaminase-like superfamily protein n=1 Tax=Colletotrichum karsti TaxID=1095194 RepID=A0A9P6LDT5_9PEZI|nr:transglutaminase-like superfamily protein [Colletotrichum karsti]KAF9869548.1 transglutaminase-like superfamily protein [Colletotrichum karsti]